MTEIMLTDTTITANSLNDYLNSILKLNKNCDNDYFYIYRGHSSVEYTLEPTIYRDNNKYLEHESNIFTDFVSKRPDFFSDCHYTIDYLAKMRHYGLATRLLDVTTNPLVALYFAVEERKKLKSGEVICFKIPKESVKSFDSDTVSILANTARLKYEYANYRIKKCSKQRQKKCQKSCTNSQNGGEAIGELFYAIQREKPHFHDMIKPCDISSVVCVKPKLSTPRIINQAGLFLLFGIKENNKMIPEIPEDWEIKHIKLNTTKEYLFNALGHLGITKSFIYPDMQYEAEEIMHNYK